MPLQDLERRCRKLYEDTIMMISNLGFPIAVTVYLLIRFEKKIETLEIALNKLTNVLSSKERK
ncbi:MULTISPECIES: YvrJ family protein [unclassified Sporosarcina]|uniref:YvrJ family protein n=1 Tax=unclassified Sporosarcina TaxID=2647733 RepID=UPI001A91B6ED